MIATANDVLDITGYSANETDIRKSQAIVEVYAGKPEALITKAADLAWMKYAISWQTAYMSTDTNSVFEQANVQSLSQNDTQINFGSKAYALAPLAQQAITRLSWNRSRSVPTAPTVGRPEIVPWEFN
jgi:hypothetical protein